MLPPLHGKHNSPSATLKQPYQIFQIPAQDNSHCSVNCLIFAAIPPLDFSNLSYRNYQKDNMKYKVKYKTTVNPTVYNSATFLFVSHF